MQARELRPKQVIELMGSKVIQIACGRQHTLALVKSSGRVYSWGLGGSGQLGLASTRNFNSPSAIASFEWTSANSSIGCVVKQIFAGGDQSFVCIPSEQCLVSFSTVYSTVRVLIPQPKSYKSSVLEQIKI
jgi:alpha-tubulin suppressor-like RCC1 family protein